MKRAFAAWMLLCASCAQGATTDGSGDPGDGGVVALDDSGNPIGIQCGAAVCPARPNAVVACSDAGACIIGQCLGDFADCNHDPNDGCEIDLDSDPANCSMCAKPCTPVTNGSPKCTVGKCGATCAPGFALLGSACASFGGAYEESDPSCTACQSPNSFAGMCGCPMGFTAVSSSRVMNDCAGATAHGAHLSFCQATGTATSGDWAGAYEIDDTNGTCPQGCRTPNPYTMTCTCPGGATPIALRTLVDTPCNQTIGSHVTLCLNATAPTTTFGGAYEMDDTGGLGCRVPNPKTMMCTCPTGTTAHDYRALVDVGGGAQHGATISVCTP
jgi:hypothetical protein